MGKKRKTRQEKIILQLKRQLAQQKSLAQKPSKPPLKGSSTAPPGTKFQSRQEAISQAHSKAKIEVKPLKKAQKSIFFYESNLVKKDLLKSLGLTLTIIALEVVLYLRLR